MQSLFLSDLHLDEQHQDIYQRFLQFVNYCEQHRHDIDNIYILGDFFEYWIGDDYLTPAIEMIYQQLKQLTQYSQHCYIMHGNRDFLLAQQFEQHSGFNILPDPSIITLDNARIIISHGDQLCTDDIEYQHMRKQFRNPQWQQQVLSQSIEQRILMAQSLRQQSKDSQRQKQPYIADVNQQAVHSLMQQQHCYTLIHGHTHRPQTHQFTINSSQQATRIVLSDWYQQGSFLKYQNGQFETILLPEQ